MKKFYDWKSIDFNKSYNIIIGKRNNVNLAILTGKLVNIQGMNENVKIGRLEDDLETYLLLWNDDLIPETTIGKQITVIANITTVKIKLEDKVKPYLTTAYKVKELEIINDI